MSGINIVLTVLAIGLVVIFTTYVIYIMVDNYLRRQPLYIEEDSISEEDLNKLRLKHNLIVIYKKGTNKPTLKIGNINK